MIAGLFAFLGHLFPVWLQFKGGKGVAVYIGVMLGLFFPAAIVFCLAWLACAFTSRYSSFSALAASAITPLFLWWYASPQLAVLATIMTLLLWIAHRDNIRRLQAGTESKIGAKS
jgi:glycerol-3-phosphate acyltransferase PlsY